MTSSEKWRAYALYCEITKQKPSHYETLKNFMKFYKEVISNVLLY